MKELTLIIDYFGHKELEEYLRSLSVIMDVNIINEKFLEIYLKI